MDAIRTSIPRDDRVEQTDDMEQIAELWRVSTAHLQHLVGSKVRRAEIPVSHRDWWRQEFLEYLTTYAYAKLLPKDAKKRLDLAAEELEKFWRLQKGWGRKLVMQDNRWRRYMQRLPRRNYPMPQFSWMDEEYFYAGFNTDYSYEQLEEQSAIFEHRILPILSRLFYLEPDEVEASIALLRWFERGGLLHLMAASSVVAGAVGGRHFLAMRPHMQAVYDVSVPLPDQDKPIPSVNAQRLHDRLQDGEWPDCQV